MTEALKNWVRGNPSVHRVAKAVFRVGREGRDALKGLGDSRRARREQLLLREQRWPAPTRPQLDFFRQFVPPGSLVFDVGANIGNKTAIFRKLGASVVALEPQPDCVEELRERFGADRRVTVVAAGLAAEAGELEMRVCTQANTISTFSEDWTHSWFEDEGFTWDKTIKVPVITLDQAVARHGAPAFIKVDVENYEFEVLAGLSEAVGVVSFEFACAAGGSFTENAIRVLHLLDELGYKQFNVALGEEPALQLKDWLDVSAMNDHIKRLSSTGEVWGDIYASVPTGKLRKAES